MTPTLETLLDLKMPLSDRLRIYAMSVGPAEAEEAVGIVSGLHGDEYDGLYIIHRLLGRLAAAGDALRKRVVFVPAVNPIGLAVSERYWPISRLDLNRRFPGRADGIAADRMAHAVLERLAGLGACVDIHASNIFLLETPQVRIAQEFADRTLPLAGRLGLDLVWVSPSPTVIETTLSYNLNRRGVPTLVVETGVGLRIHRAMADRVVEGILGFLVHLGVLAPEAGPPPPEPPVLAHEDDVIYLNAGAAGLFLPEVPCGTEVKKGDPVGAIVDPFEPDPVETIAAPEDGLLFTIRAHPVVYPGSLLARIVRKNGAFRRWAA